MRPIMPIIVAVGMLSAGVTAHAPSILKFLFF